MNGEQIITDATFKDHQGFDLALFDDRTMPASDLPSFRVPKQQTFTDFKAKLAEDMGYDPNSIRLWVLVNRQNKTVRPDTVVPENDPTLSASLTIFVGGSNMLMWMQTTTAMEVVRDKMASKTHDLKLYLEHLDDYAKAPPGDAKDQPIMIFVKHFDVTGQTLNGLGHFYVTRHQKVGDLVPQINAKMNYPPETPLRLYEVRSPCLLEGLDSTDISLAPCRRSNLA